MFSVNSQIAENTKKLKRGKRKNYNAIGGRLSIKVDPKTRKILDVISRYEHKSLNFLCDYAISILISHYKKAGVLPQIEGVVLEAKRPGRKRIYTELEL